MQPTPKNTSPREQKKADSVESMRSDVQAKRVEARDDEASTKVRTGSGAKEDTSTPQPPLTPEQAGERLVALLKDFSVAMLVTREGKSLSARPMSIAQVDAQTKTAWFVSSIDADRTRALEFAPRVQVVCQSSLVHLSIAGNATVLKDAAKLDELWKEPMRLWFPEGKSAPDLALIKVELGEGEFWDQSGARGFKFIFDAAKAWITGEAIEPDPQAHARTNLHQA